MQKENEEKITYQNSDESKKYEENIKQAFIINPQLYKKILNKSSIIRSNQQINKLFKKFDKQVKDINLIFRASQNDFSLIKYREKHLQQTDTLFICRTNNNKIICAYTPLSHKYTCTENIINYKTPNQGQYVQDKSQTSFIYSMTNDDKFKLTIKSRAIVRWLHKVDITFGDWQFNICDKANINNDCRSRIYTAYQNQKYKTLDSESYMRLNGNDNWKFTTKQWQAWKITF